MNESCFKAKKKDFIKLEKNFSNSPVTWEEDWFS